MSLADLDRTPVDLDDDAQATPELLRFRRLVAGIDRLHQRGEISGITRRELIERAMRSAGLTGNGRRCARPGRNAP